MKPTSWDVSKCRACGGDTINVFSLGRQQLSDFPPPDSELQFSGFPLTLMRCHPCGLIQLNHTVNPDLLYKNNYWYRSGINESMRAALKDVVLRAIEMTGLGMYDRELVVDIGANDGTLLSFYPRDIFTVGVDPAVKLHEQLRKNCDLLIPDYFPCYDTRSTLAAGDVRVVTTVAMFYDLDDPNEFVAEVKRILHEHGLWIIQMADLGLMLQTGGYDNICHEHLEYYSVSSLQSLLAKHDLKILKVEFNQVNGGSMRCYVTHKNSTIVVPPSDVTFLRSVVQTEENYVRTNDPWIEFEAKAQQHRIALGRMIHSYNTTGKTVDLLGASTKANTLLQFCQLGSSMIRRAIDRDPRKAGRTTITGIPIVGEEEGREEPADVLLLAPWHFRDSITKREAGKWPKGTKMIIPPPVLEEIDVPMSTET